EERFHASGHASGPELIEMVREIRPQILIPIHTEHPEIFARELAGDGIEVRIPKIGQEIEFEKGRRIHDLAEAG
ncbi:MAG: MBL fold metallo-hydrolase RNA specificity domain-containing protein, partial [Chloroflexota bacterium]|nr:MBL fold metallo-hydrolase RNA specificity domain-containing protein [Chloroflexota bacterium]